MLRMQLLLSQAETGILQQRADGDRMAEDLSRKKRRYFCDGCFLKWCSQVEADLKIFKKKQFRNSYSKGGYWWS